MSGMFQRIARRHADRPDEPTADTATEPAADTPAATKAAPAAEAAAAETSTGGDQSSVSQPSDDRPTERMEAVAPPAADHVQPTADHVQPAAPPSGAAPATAATQPAQAATPVATDPEQTVGVEPAQRRPGFRARGRMRRRLRYLRKLRELQVRDLGGLVFDLRRFERKRDDLIAQKIDQIRACDDELHALERAIDERRDLRDVREPGIGGTCPRCFAIYGSADKFCSSCGAAFGGAVQGPAAQVPLASPTTTPPPPANAPEASGSGPQT